MKEGFWVNRKNLNHQAKQPLTDTQTAVFEAQHDTHKLEEPVAGFSTTNHPLASWSTHVEWSYLRCFVCLHCFLCSCSNLEAGARSSVKSLRTPSKEFWLSKGSWKILKGIKFDYQKANKNNHWFWCKTSCLLPKISSHRLRGWSTSSIYKNFIVDH